MTSDEFIDKMEAAQKKKALDTYLKEERKYLRDLKKQGAFIYNAGVCLHVMLVYNYVHYMCGASNIVLPV